MAAAFALASVSVSSAAVGSLRDACRAFTQRNLLWCSRKPILFPARHSPGLIATLQSLGYVDINASKDAGTISAQTEAKGKIFYNILWGFGKKKLTQKASLLVEDYGTNQVQIRLNLHVTETKARGIFGTSFSDGKLVKVAEPYTAFFTALDAEVARRAVPAAIPPAPVSPGTANANVSSQQ